MLAVPENWTALEWPDGFVRQWEEMNPGVDVPQGFDSRGGLRVVIGYEPVVEDDPRWHISVTREDRLPTWRDLVEVAHLFRPGVCFVVGIPPRSWWVNVHEFCLHLWETTDEHLIEEWRRNARGDEPT